MRPKATSKKTVSKQCPECDQQIPVACKACPCGHNFKLGRDIGPGSGAEESNAPKTPTEGPAVADAEPPSAQATSAGLEMSSRRRRTERVKRERPDYFQALEFVGRRRRTNSASQSSGSEDHAKKKRGRPRANLNKSKDEAGVDKEPDVFTNLPIEKAMQYAVILAEINRKYSSQNFKP